LVTHAILVFGQGPVAVHLPLYTDSGPVGLVEETGAGGATNGFEEGMGLGTAGTGGGVGMHSRPMGLKPGPHLTHRCTIFKRGSVNSRHASGFAAVGVVGVGGVGGVDTGAPVDGAVAGAYGITGEDG
jgi:hypothetical protein